jgi:hypothetical protein
MVLDRTFGDVERVNRVVKRWSNAGEIALSAPATTPAHTFLTSLCMPGVNQV